MEVLAMIALAFVSFGAIVWENVAWGPAQGCLIVFAGIGFACGH